MKKPQSLPWGGGPLAPAWLEVGPPCAFQALGADAEGWSKTMKENTWRGPPTCRGRFWIQIKGRGARQGWEKGQGKKRKVWDTTGGSGVAHLASTGLQAKARWEIHALIRTEMSPFLACHSQRAPRSTKDKVCLAADLSLPGLHGQAPEEGEHC